MKYDRQNAFSRMVRVYESNIIFHFSLLSDESGGGGFAMAYQRLHDLVVFCAFYRCVNSGESLTNLR